MVGYSGMALGMCGISTIFTAMCFHCAPNAAIPSEVIRFTVRAGGSAGAIVGAGTGAGACAAARPEIIAATAASPTHANVLRKSDLRIVSPSAVC